MNIGKPQRMWQADPVQVPAPTSPPPVETVPQPTPAREEQPVLVPTP